MEVKDNKATMRPHQLIAQDRKLLDLTGVSDVDSFDENTVVAYTSLGELTIRGQGLHIRHLDVEGGLLSVEGLVDTLSYSDPVRGGFFSRLLR
ncbi:MAG: sporulation protein YabP [Clostridia bacterium]|nr:sporulation protein YabP [Clostridia bacterium]